jgi:hypothetical protein
MKQQRCPSPRLPVRVRTLERELPPRAYQLVLLLAAVSAAALLAGCVVVAEDAPIAAQVERAVEVTAEPAAGGRLQVANLAGVVQIESAIGPQVRVLATVYGGGQDDAEAQSLADAIELTLEQEDELVRVVVRYPTERGTSFHYPHMTGVFSFLAHDFLRTRLEYQGDEVTIVSRRSGGALSVWVDLVVQVPAGITVEIENAAGSVEADDLDSDLVVEAHSGDVRVTGGDGGARLATGSGDITVEDRAAAVAAATGSGDVTVSRVRGAVDVTTGSGDVDLVDVEGDSVRVRTGSGDLALTRVHAAADLGTGSGDVDAVDMVLHDLLLVRTGSGDLAVAGAAELLVRADLETGSGSVDLDLSGLPPLSLRLHTSSGRIEADLENLEVTREDEEVLEGRTGPDPQVEIRVETGSGDVTLRETTTG